MTTTDIRPGTTTSGPRTGGTATLVLNVVAPIAAYYALHLLGYSDLVALAAGAVFPLLGTAVTAIRTRRVDAIGVVSFLGMLAGVAIAALVHDPRIVLVTNALPGLVTGVMFLASLFGRRSLIEQMVGQLGRSIPMTPAVRSRLRQLTAAWGAAIVVSASAHVAIALLVAPSAAVVLSPVASALAQGPAAVWTLHLKSRAKRLQPAA
jgi:hypothetical protein